MDRSFEIKTKSFFEIPPRLRSQDSDSREIPPRMRWQDSDSRVVFMNTAFDLEDIIYISEVYEIRTMHYVFFVHLIHKEFKLEFEFKRKGDALMAQRELSRAWTKTGEFCPTSPETDLFGDETDA